MSASSCMRASCALSWRSIDGAEALAADPAAVFVAHPIQDRSAEEMREIADRAFDARVG